MTRGRERRGEGIVFVLSSPSGGGKTTAAQALVRRVPGLVRSVSVTTRPPRASEQRDVDYRFVTSQAFTRLRRRGALLEWARVHGACYGTPKAAVERAWRRGDDALLCIDVQGARTVRRRLGRRAVLIFLLPPSRDVLRRRLRARRTEPAEAIQQRLRVAQRELARVREYEYAVVNRRLAEAVDQLRAIVIAERLRIGMGRGRPTKRGTHGEVAD